MEQKIFVMQNIHGSRTAFKIRGKISNDTFLHVNHVFVFSYLLSLVHLKKIFSLSFPFRCLILPNERLVLRQSGKRAE